MRFSHFIVEFAPLNVQLLAERGFEAPYVTVIIEQGIDDREVLADQIILEQFNFIATQFNEKRATGSKKPAAFPHHAAKDMDSIFAAVIGQR